MIQLHNGQVIPGNRYDRRIWPRTSKRWREASGDLTFKLDTLHPPLLMVPTVGAIMDFAAVLATCARCWSGNQLSVLGGSIQQRAPLRWFHDGSKIVGNFVKVLHTDYSKTIVQCCLHDTRLGMEVSHLVRLGYVQMSHGFKAIEHEFQKDGRGYAVKRWESHELTLTNEPDNAATDILEWYAAPVRTLEPFKPAVVYSDESRASLRTMFTPTGGNQVQAVAAVVQALAATLDTSVTKPAKESAAAPVSTTASDYRPAMPATQPAGAQLSSPATQAPPNVPAGAQLLYRDEDSAPCHPDIAKMWTWSGSREWYDTKSFPIPR
jgi:hypothetical protein